MNELQEKAYNESSARVVIKWIEEGRYDIARYINVLNNRGKYDDNGELTTDKKIDDQYDVYRNKTARQFENEKQQFIKMQQFVNFDSFEKEISKSQIQYHLKHDRAYDRSISLVDNIKYYVISDYFSKVANNEQKVVIYDMEMDNFFNNDEITLRELKQADKKFMLHMGHDYSEFFDKE